MMAPPHEVFNTVKYVLSEPLARTMLAKMDRASSVGGVCGF